MNAHTKKMVQATTITTLLALCMFAGSTDVLAQAGSVAQPINELVTGVGNNAGFTSNNLPSFIAMIIQILLSLLGVIFLILVIYAGYEWMLAKGETGKVKAAKDLLRESVIGLIIVLAANIITTFVIRSLNQQILNR